MAAQAQIARPFYNHAGFLELPPELRNRIYELNLPEPGHLYRTLSPRSVRAVRARELARHPPLRKSPFWFLDSRHEDQGYFTANPIFVGLVEWWGDAIRCPVLMKVSRQLRQEMSPMFYGPRHVYACLTMSDVPAVACWLRIIALDSGAENPFTRFQLTISDATWTCLHDLLPLVEVIRDTALDHRHPGFHIMTGSRRDQRPRVHDAVLRGLDLGIRARVEIWSESRLQDEFLRWLHREKQEPVVKRYLEVLESSGMKEGPHGTFVRR